MSFFNPNTRHPGKKRIGRALGRDKFSPGLGNGGLYEIQGQEVLDGANFCSMTFGIAPNEPTYADLNKAATQLQSMPELLETANTGGGSESAVAGNTTYPSLPLVRRGALIIFNVPSKPFCYGGPAHAHTGHNLNPTDNLHGHNFAAHKGFKSGRDNKVPSDILTEVAFTGAELMRESTLGNIQIVDKNGKIGMDTFQGQEFTYPDDGTINCRPGPGTTPYNEFCGNSFESGGFKGTVHWARDLLLNDPRFLPYHYLWVINLGCWNAKISGGFQNLSDQPWLSNNTVPNTDDNHKIYTWGDIGHLNVPGGIPGDPIDPGQIHSEGSVSPLFFIPNVQWSRYPESWDWAVNLWDLRYADSLRRWYGMMQHEIGHGTRPGPASPNFGMIGGMKHPTRPGSQPQSPYVETPLCNFMDTGPNDPAGECAQYWPGNSTANMNYHHAMSYPVLNNTHCGNPWVPCSPPNTNGRGPESPGGMDSAFNVALLHWMDLLPDNNVVDLTNVDQSVPNTILFDDWLWAGDLFHIHPELTDLGSRKVLIRQEMHTNLNYPWQWDNIVPAPKRRAMYLQYYGRGYIEKRASVTLPSMDHIDVPDGVVLLCWGAYVAVNANMQGLRDIPPFARLDVSSGPTGPAPPLIIHGFDTEIPANPATRFYGWKVETVDFTNEQSGTMSKVRIRITSLGEG